MVADGTYLPKPYAKTCNHFSFHFSIGPFDPQFEASSDRFEFLTNGDFGHVGIKLLNFPFIFSKSIGFHLAACSSKVISAKRFTLMMGVGGTAKHVARLEFKLFISFSY